MSTKRTVFFLTERADNIAELMLISPERLGEINTQLFDAIDKGIDNLTLESVQDIFAVASSIAETDAELVYMAYKIGGIEDDISKAVMIRLSIAEDEAAEKEQQN